jgi:hypothetical protein
MKKLNAIDYCKVQNPLNEVTINTMFAQTAIDQKVEGAVLVDSCVDPTVFYITHFYGMSLLFGNFKNDTFNNWLRDYLINKNNVRSNPEWLQAFPSSWNKTIDTLLGSSLVKNDNLMNQANSASRNEGKVLEIERINFSFSLDLYKKSMRQFGRHDYKIVRTTKELFKAINGSVVPKSIWSTSEQFINIGVGFCLVINGEAVSTSFSAFKNNNQLEIGIETKAEFRGRGFAWYVCSALIDYCIENHLEPVWACNSINIGSYRLAEKLGFVRTLTLPNYILPS